MTDKPHWKADFPIRQSEEHRVSRRQFAMFACCSAAVFGAAWLAKGKGLAPRVATEPKFIARTDELPVGGSKLFRYPTEADPCILIRLATDRFAAYSQSCTHLKCPVYFKSERNELVCPCHEGFFSADDGHVLAGPPQHALPSHPIEVRDQEIWVLPPRPTS
jgi:nitrite reductase/ring-hydroxylating ferredoxin subunit